LKSGKLRFSSNGFGNFGTFAHALESKRGSIGSNWVMQAMLNLSEKVSQK
jgi:hypothetical protein